MGKTDIARQRQIEEKKHPHMRGEDTTALTDSAKRLETPPHAWGRPGLIKHTENFGGNTPTCVGKTAGNAYDNYLA